MNDNENFLTSDESHVMMWNLERPGKSEVYNLIDYNRHKYQSGEERILSMSCSSTNNTFIYTTSTGCIRICDLRESSNFTNRPTIELKMKKRKSAVDIIESGLAQVTDAKFVPFSEHNVLSRDYLATKLWDVRTAQSNGYAASSMIVDTEIDASPVWSAQVTDYMEKNLADL